MQTLQNQQTQQTMANLWKFLYAATFGSETKNNFFSSTLDVWLWAALLLCDSRCKKSEQLLGEAPNWIGSNLSVWLLTMMMLPDPIGSMGLVYLPTFTINLYKFMVNVGKYTSPMDPIGDVNLCPSTSLDRFGMSQVFVVGYHEEQPSSGDISSSFTSTEEATSFALWLGGANLRSLVHDMSLEIGGIMNKVGLTKTAEI